MATLDSILALKDMILSVFVLVILIGSVNILDFSVGSVPSKVYRITAPLVSQPKLISVEFKNSCSPDLIYGSEVIRSPFSE